MNQFDENAWWGDVANTWHEEQKQFVYAKRMGLQANWNCAHPPTYDLGNKSVIDIGGGPVSLLLKSQSYTRAVVADPGMWPEWVTQRYAAHNVEYWRTDGEDVEGYTFDEAWIYNTLQHVRDPELVIKRAHELVSPASGNIRIFEWVDLEPYPGHPNRLTQTALDDWLGAPGYVTTLNESGAVGRAYYGVFRGRS